MSQVPVTTLIGEALPHTLILAAAGLGLAALIGIPLGVFASTRPNSIGDRMAGIVSISLITVPAYVAGLFLLLIFAVELDWFPAIGTGDFSDPVDYLKHLALPAIALALTWIGYLARLTRTSMFEVLNQNYIRTAQAFGLPDRRIYYKYALKNAIIPIVAVLGVGLGTLMGGAVFVEIIFTRAGLGTLILDSIQNRNFPIVRGSVLVIAVLFVFAEPARRPLLPPPRSPGSGRARSRLTDGGRQLPSSSHASRALRPHGRRAHDAPGGRPPAGRPLRPHRRRRPRLPRDLRAAHRAVRPSRAGHPEPLAGTLVGSPARDRPARPGPALAPDLRRASGAERRFARRRRRSRDRPPARPDRRLHRRTYRQLDDRHDGHAAGVPGGHPRVGAPRAPGRVAHERDHRDRGRLRAQLRPRHARARSDHEAEPVRGELPDRSAPATPGSSASTSFPT